MTFRYNRKNIKYNGIENLLIFTKCVINATHYTYSYIEYNHKLNKTRKCTLEIVKI